MTTKFKPLAIGTKVGRLEVVGLPVRAGKYLKIPVKCECGTEKQIEQSNLRSGRVSSCGCYLKEWAVERFTKHGKRNSPIYAVWNMMLQRCCNPNNAAYKYYGGKGITVSESWKIFENFFADMGDPPFVGASLDRIDSKQGYYKENVRWATGLEQANNKSNNIVFDVDGKTYSLRELAEISGINKNTLSTRIYTYGLTAKEAITQPVLTHSQAGNLVGTPIFETVNSRQDGKFLYSDK